MKRLTYTLLAIVIFALIWALPAMAQDTTDEPTPTAEVTTVATAPDVTVVVEQPPAPVDTTPDSSVLAFLFAGVAFALIAAASYFAKQHNLNLDIVAKTVPIEFAQFVFRQAMTQALSTPMELDDEALKTFAKELGYEVFVDTNGAFTIRASAQAVAQNVATAQAATDTAVKKGQY